jgi:hypothetical protein
MRRYTTAPFRGQPLAETIDPPEYPVPSQQKKQFSREREARQLIRVN